MALRGPENHEDGDPEVRDGRQRRKRERECRDKWNQRWRWSGAGSRYRGTERKKQNRHREIIDFRYQKICKPKDTQQDQGPREMGSATKNRKHREEDGERHGWSGRFLGAEDADPIGGGGFWKCPQMAAGGGSETITPNPARKQKQVA